ncbi:hypothetical protein [Paremcibacter congregatus]|uniref:hypothetical protein n=1 Tax=Paremcibacter congregatus TaxID=2043170 RepID=UPI0030ECB79F
MGLPAKIDYNATPTAGQKLVVAIPRDVSYEEFQLIGDFEVGNIRPLTAAQWDAQIEEIRLVIGGRNGATEVIKASSGKIASVNRFYNEAYQTPGVLPLYFSRPWMDELGAGVNGRDHTILGLLGMDTAKLEITFKAGTVINDFQVWGMTQPAQRPGQLVRLIQEEMDITKAGDYSDFQFDRADYAFVALHFDTTVFDKVEFRLNRRLAYESIKDIRSALANSNGKTEQAGFCHLDFNTRNQLGIHLPMNVSTYNLKVNSSGVPGTVIILKEIFETIAA